MLINRNTEAEVKIIYLDIKCCTFKNVSRAKLIKMSSNNNVICERTNDASFLILISEVSESKTFGTKLFVLLPITLIWILTLVRGHGQRGNGAWDEKKRNEGAGAGKNNQSQMRVICLSLRPSFNYSVTVYSGGKRYMQAGVLIHLFLHHTIKQQYTSKIRLN